MTDALNELKVRARLRLNAVRAAGREARLRDCLHEVSRAAGFLHWEHARLVLSGEAGQGADMGAFWWAPSCAAFFSEWHTDVSVARRSLEQGARFLLPYRRQFVVVERGYLIELGLEPGSPLWPEIGYDLVRAYGSAAWRALCAARLRGRPAR